MLKLTLRSREIQNYKTERIPKSEPADKSEQSPGLLCWGDPGTLPKPVPVSTGFETKPAEEHVELSRITEPVTITSDDGAMSVTARRTKEMQFSVTDNTGKSGNNNTSTGGEDFSDFSPSATGDT